MRSMYSAGLRFLSILKMQSYFKMSRSSTSMYFLYQITLFALYGALYCIRQSEAETTKTLKAFLTCDQKMTVYTDGKYAGTNGGRNKPVAFRLSPGTHVLAVRCLKLRGEAGILGSLSNALVTDSRWKCTGRGNRYRIKGKYWTKALFDDSDWPQAVEYFPNRGWTYWGKMSDISDKAFWIWTVDKGKHEEVYCRRRVSDVSVRHRKRGEIFQASLKEVDHSLLLHSRSRFEVKSVSQCAQKCRADSMCLAFNFQHSSSSSLRQCELKDASRNQDPTNYVKRRGYTYYEDVGGGL